MSFETTFFLYFSISFLFPYFFSIHSSPISRHARDHSSDTHTSHSIPVQGIQHVLLKTSFITLNTIPKNISDFLKMIIEIFTQDFFFFTLKYFLWALAILHRLFIYPDSHIYFKYLVFLM